MVIFLLYHHTKPDLVFFYYQFIILANYVEDGSNEIEKLNDYLEQFTEILSKFEKKAEDFFAEK